VGQPGDDRSGLGADIVLAHPLVLAEADPASATILPGFLAGNLPADRGIGELAVAGESR
jgi:hypothetical protein